MKKCIIFAVVICAMLAFSGESFSALVSMEAGKDAPIQDEPVSPAKEEKIVSEKAPPAKQIAKQKELVADKRKELEGSIWEIAVAPSGDKTRAKIDTITFSEGRVSSKNLGALGYGATNFTLRVQEDGTATWESMQTSEADGVTFWLGNLMDGVMSGRISKRDKKNNTTDYSFTSSRKK